MSRQGTNRRDGGWTAGRALRLGLAVASASFWCPASRAQGPAGPGLVPGPAPVPVPGPMNGPAPVPGPIPRPGVGAPGMVVVEGGAPPVVMGGPMLPTEVQVVRFQGPPGVMVEVLDPRPEPVSLGDGHGLATVGLRVGV